MIQLLRQNAIPCLLILGFVLIGCNQSKKPTPSEGGSGMVEAGAESGSDLYIDAPPGVVEVDNIYDFGDMRLGETLSHDFVVKNVGKGPLRLGEPQTTCKCTVANTVDDAIPPGGEASIKLEWTPKAPSEEFSQMARIPVIDHPDFNVIQLMVKGRVDEQLRVEPPGVWQLGEVPGDQPVDVSGQIYSTIIGDFEVKSFESDSGFVEASFKKLSPERLKELHPEAKNGYEINATVLPKKEIGNFREELVVKTSLEDAEEINLVIRGDRTGPIRFVPKPGVKWYPEARAVSMGDFQSSKGATAEVNLFVGGMDEETPFEITKVETTADYVDLELIPQPKLSNPKRQRHLLKFIVKPGAPIISHFKKGAVKVTAHTNHPLVEQIKFFVEMRVTPG
ncbi:DUF1573 domain-containing protein [Calycomorphotria hydatis]|uniref:DUF1573 domain-containing protein n=1 Tax=Calycomorphotria hydatis TaxID=2528027 RepID=A0A517TCJ5_9PLAN|nr:DUF1573 domain-containing protein [Calycomorphotria hydatis]QDT66095.1 hypothetical protein V22_33590 [Calycomorphotria hydatis]